MTPDLAGVRTWERAVMVAADADAFAAALRSQAGARTRPDAELRAWALAQTADEQNGRCGSGWRRSASRRGRLGRERLSRDRTQAQKAALAAAGAKPGSGTLVAGEAPSANP